jgi:hypothetical protein
MPWSLGVWDVGSMTEGPYIRHIILWTNSSSKQKGRQVGAKFKFKLMKKIEG